MYLGNQPALSYTSFAKQDFTTSATTSYTLNQPVANANELALFINFVRQEPTTAYTASGTTLTLTSATSASDDMYCVFLGKAVQTVNPPIGSVGISQLSATGTKDATTFLRGDNTFASAGGTNTPAFSAKMSSGQDIGYTGVWTKINFTSEQFDIGSYYDASNAKFTPSAGKYFVYYNLYYYGSLGTTLQQLYSTIYKNGVDNAIFRGRIFVSNNINSVTLKAGAIIELNGTDYLEVYAQSNNVSTGSTIVDDVSSVFGAYKIIE